MDIVGGRSDDVAITMPVATVVGIAEHGCRGARINGHQAERRDPERKFRFHGVPLWTVFLTVAIDFSIATIRDMSKMWASEQTVCGSRIWDGIPPEKPGDL
jgi:hypothetical protein